MKEEAARADKQVANEADEEDGVMALFSAGLNAEIGEVDKEEVCECVDYLGCV